MSMNVEAERLRKNLLAFQAKTQRRFDEVIGGLDRITASRRKFKTVSTISVAGFADCGAICPISSATLCREVMNGKSRKKQ
jgi:hypothetical protein